MGEKIKKEILEWTKVIVSACVLSVIITQLVKPTLVKGESMYPTLEENDYLIVNRIAYKIGDPEQGDVIVYHSNLTDEEGKSKDLVKRVIAAEGDHIKIQNSEVFVNGQKLEEDYINVGQTYGEIDATVPQDKVFTMGDNRENSMDSRYEEIGMVDEDEILGKVSLRLYPFDKIGFID